MDFTSRMTALLGAFRRERNGAVADSMRCYGRPCGLNYGVSLPTLRRLARAEGTDHDFARYLYRQDVRELRLAAFHIADPARLTPEEYPFWGERLLNSELAEEGAFALFCHAVSFGTLFGTWTSPGTDPLWQYAALMSVARAAEPQAAWIPQIVDTLHRAAVAALPESRLLAQGAVAALVALGSLNEENRRTVHRAAGSLGSLPAEDFVHEELAWRLDPGC